MLFFKIDQDYNALEIPIKISELRKRVNTVSIPEEPDKDFLFSIGYGCVDSDLEPEKFPKCDAGQTVGFGLPIRIGDGWEKTYVLKKMDAQEVNFRLNELRNKRNILLAKSDFTQLQDYQDLLSDLGKEEWRKFRQELRDLPETTKNLKDIKWPHPPSRI